MKKITALLFASLLLSACSKNPDNPPQVAASPSNPNPPPPEASHCQGATVPYSMPIDTINDAEVKAFTIPNFYIDCGDTLRVYIGHPQSWSEIPNFDNGASYYGLVGNVVTIHNKTGQSLLVDIEAILK